MDRRCTLLLQISGRRNHLDKNLKNKDFIVISLFTERRKMIFNIIVNGSVYFLRSENNGDFHFNGLAR